MWARTVGSCALALMVHGGGGQTRPSAATGAPAVQSDRQPADSHAQAIHALLIGVSTYPSLGPQHQLEGPANDVALMRDTLTSAPFEVNPFRITELVEPATRSGPQPPAPPTRANIQREFMRLAGTVRPGDQVVVLFAGHGSQQPDTGPRPDEDDGLDEILLPSDIGAWDGRVGHVEGAITDDELRDWLSAIRRQGAFVWMIVDACQSASATRGNREVQRWVPPSALGVPSAPVPSARTRGTPQEYVPLGLDATSGDIAALYAAQTTEPTPEKLLPENSDVGRVHGLFTFTLVKMLRQATGHLTYRDLAERVVQDYRALGRIGPTPAFEGGGLDRSVLGTTTFSRRARPLLGGTEDGRAILRAGAVHGLTTGTILAVHPPGSTDASSPLGHVQVTGLGPTTAIVIPVAYGGMPPPATAALQLNSWCEVVFHDFGLTALRVAYEITPGAPSGLAQLLRDSMAQLPTTSRGMARPVPDDAQADWIVRLASSGELTLAPVSGWRIDDALPQADDRQAPFTITQAGSELATELGDALVLVARGRNLLRLAVAAREESDVAVSIDVLRYTSAAPHGQPILPENGFRTVRVGDEIAFRFRNNGTLVADVTLLYVDADYGVGVLFPLPDQEATAQLQPGAELTTVRMKVTPPTGWEHVLVVATAKTAIRTDLRVLEQPPLRRARTRSIGDTEQHRSLPDSALGRLLHMATNLRGGMRGQPVARVREHAIRVLTWRTESSADGAGGAASR